MDSHLTNVKEKVVEYLTGLRNQQPNEERTATMSLNESQQIKEPSVQTEVLTQRGGGGGGGGGQKGVWSQARSHVVRMTTSFIIIMRAGTNF